MLFGQSPGQVHANEEHPVEAQLFPLATNPNREQSELPVPPLPVNPPLPAAPPVIEVVDPPPPVPADPELESSDPQPAVAASATPMKTVNPPPKPIDPSMFPIGRSCGAPASTLLVPSAHLLSNECESGDERCRAHLM